MSQRRRCDTEIRPGAVTGKSQRHRHQREVVDRVGQEVLQFTADRRNIRNVAPVRSTAKLHHDQNFARGRARNISMARCNRGHPRHGGLQARAGYVDVQLGRRIALARVVVEAAGIESVQKSVIVIEHVTQVRADSTALEVLRSGRVDGGGHGLEQFEGLSEKGRVALCEGHGRSKGSGADQFLEQIMHNALRPCRKHFAAFTEVRQWMEYDLGTDL